MNKKQKSIDKIRDEFSYILHDLRRELGTIQAFLDRKNTTVQVSNEDETVTINNYGELLDHAKKFFNKQWLDELERSVNE